MDSGNTENHEIETDFKRMESDDKLLDELTFLEKVRHHAGYRMRFLHSVFVIWLFITLGWTVSIEGSTFPDLRLIINKDLDTASWLFTAGNLGYLLGALLGGIAFDRFNRLVLLSVTAFGHSATIIALPFMESFPLMLTVFAVNGFFLGLTDVGGNTHVASIWGQRAAPFMQSIHFGFSFGGTISPFTAEPFVAEEKCIYPDETATVTLGYNDNRSSTPSADCFESYGETKVQYAFIIDGFVSASVAIPFIVLYCLSKTYNTNITTSLESETIDAEISVSKEEKSIQDHKPNTVGLPELSLNRKIIFVCLLMIMISAYAGGEGRFSSLITTFVTDYLTMSKADSLHLASLFWGTFAGGRFLGIIVTRFLKTKTMLLVYILCLILNYIAFLFAAVFDIRELIWACTAIGGLSMSVIFPAIFTWTAESIMPVTGVISSIYIVGVSVFNMLGPLLYGYLMDNFSQMYFAYLVLAQFVVCMVLYVLIRILVAAFIKPFHRGTGE